MCEAHVQGLVHSGPWFVLWDTWRWIAREEKESVVAACILNGSCKLRFFIFKLVVASD
jgi:hypothetical protein